MHVYKRSSPFTADSTKSLSKYKTRAMSYNLLDSRYFLHVFNIHTCCWHSTRIQIQDSTPIRFICPKTWSISSRNYQFNFHRPLMTLICKFLVNVITWPLLAIYPNLMNFFEVLHHCILANESSWKANMLLFCQHEDKNFFVSCSKAYFWIVN